MKTLAIRGCQKNKVWDCVFKKRIENQGYAFILLNFQFACI